MANNDVVAVPATYTNSLESHIRVTNHPASAPGVTPILVATLNRPNKLNAITSGMIYDLIGLFRAVDVDDRVKVVVLTGAGKAFSAGIDLTMDTSQAKNQVPLTEMRDPGGTLALAMFNCSKPIIVAYNGLSVGIGMTSTLAATIRIAARTSEFGFPFSRIGITMESCSSFFLPRMVGYSNATYLLATGQRYPADTPALNGIFAELLPEPKDVLPRALELANDLLANVSLMAAYLNRQLIWRNPGSAERAHLVDSPLLYDMFGGDDHLEFKKAFFGKRKPEFKGKITENAPRTYPWWDELSVQTRPKAKTDGATASAAFYCAMGAALSTLFNALSGRLHPRTFSYDDALDSRTIRLLSFVRPKWYTFGLCKPQLVMSKYSMNGLPKYVALSYTWGAPLDNSGEGATMALNGLQRRWDYEDDTQHMWIDAICINQNDLVERAAQVGIMDQVYKRSSTTAIWLGNGGPEADSTIEMFEAIQRISSEEFAPYYRQYPNGAAPPATFWLQHGLPDFDDEGPWRPVVRFFEHRWFNRAWIIQEATLSSNNIYVFWGRHAMTWDDLGHVAFAGQVARLGNMAGQPVLARYLAGDAAMGEVHDWVTTDDDTMLGEMRALTGCEEASAASWLMYFALSNRWADASDARDKVFCHLGLVSNIAAKEGLASSDVQPNYSPAVVLMAVNDPPSSRLAGLPSWVPDLSRRQGLDLMCEGTLHAQAIVIGSVTTLLSLDPVYSYTGESRVEAFWRTLLMDSVARRHPAEWPGKGKAGDMFRAYVLQSMTRYYPGAGADSATREKYACSLRDVNELALSDASGHLPSFNGLGDLTAQIAGVDEQQLVTLPDEAVLQSLHECVEKASEFLLGMDGSMVNRRIVMSNGGHIANAPMWTEIGDTIAVLDRCPCPVVLRPVNSKGATPSCWNLVGPAYVHGGMYGEFVRPESAWEDVRIRPSGVGLVNIINILLAGSKPPRARVDRRETAPRTPAMDLAMPLQFVVDGQPQEIDQGWADCILTSRPIPGAWRPSVGADPNLSAVLSASSYPFPTPDRRQRPNPSVPMALYGGLHMNAPWDEPATGYDAATSESDSAERIAPDTVPGATKAKRRRKSRAQGNGGDMGKMNTAEKKVGRPRKSVDTSDCDDPEERRRRQIRLAQRAYRLRKESRISFLESRVSQLESSVDRMSAAVVSFGSQLVESKVLMPHPELRDSLGETVQTCLESVRESSSSRGDNDEQDMQRLSAQARAAPTTTASLPLELYTAPLPPVDLSLLGPGNGVSTQGADNGLLTLSHAAFMEKMHSSIVYYGYSLLADPSTPVELLSRHFRLALSVMDRKHMLAYFAASLQAKLSGTRVMGDWSDMPFFQLNGAGSHYSWLEDHDTSREGQKTGESGDHGDGDAPSSALTVYSRRSRRWPKIVVSSAVLPSGVQDDFEGEWFDMQDLELFLRERNTRLFRIDPGGAPTGAGPRSVPRSKGFINAEWLLRTLLNKATCLGRSAGFRRRDVEEALSSSV
ncbi:E3 ubiquitin-protein ligase MARCH6 [Purpureocillium lavendulum]|uniref:E3 ubiquitin-protein ligase MARCH6 n=1 Tax=Purpureocillium lavendulum TaxID=1247861 RepID=A0AB34FYC1_9HYPO|nr:E3 ubiquitin-protein ligase MARCH6 [Purpureocillium lavendulum]